MLLGVQTATSRVVGFSFIVFLRILLGGQGGLLPWIGRTGYLTNTHGFVAINFIMTEGDTSVIDKVVTVCSALCNCCESVVPFE